MTPLRVCVVGQPAVPEFAAALDHLAQIAQVQFAEPEAAFSGCDPARPPGSVPQLVVFLSPRPDSIERSAVEAWQRRFPLAFFAVLLGSWCEGELRSGRPWPGVARIYWYQAAARLSAVVSRESAANRGWLAPRTATEAEWLELGLPAAESAATAHGDGAAPGARAVAVRATNSTSYEVLADACRWAGYRVSRWSGESIPPAARPALVVWDLDRSLDVGPLAAEFGAAGLSGIPVLAIVGFPRWHDQRAAQSAGITVMAKPYRLADLQWHLADLVGAPHSTNDLSPDRRPLPSGGADRVR